MIAALFALATLATPAIAEVYRCTEGGTVVYADHPCGAKAVAVPIAADPNAPERGKLTPGTKLDVSPAVADACWDSFTPFARDPTTAKRLSHFAEAGKDGLPWLIVNGVFTNRVGGPERRFVRCRLNDDLSLNKAGTKLEVEAFHRSQMGL